MSMLTVIQRFCTRTGLTSPATVYGTTDPQIRQVLALLEEEGTDLSKRGDWNELTFEATHTTTAVEDQGAITTIASNGFNYIKNGTIWDRDLRLPVYVIDGANWQAAKAIDLNGPRYQARIRGGKLISNPVPVAGHTWAFEYISNNWILGIDGTTYKEYFTLDTDTILLPESIVLMGLRWRWKKEKGLSYDEDFRTYEMQVEDALSRNGMKRTLNMGNPESMVSPGVVVPLGSWLTP